MILIIAILAATRASPLGLRSPPVVSGSFDQLQSPGPSCDDPNGCRSLLDIIRSCILTILLCTYVSMHPNIPSPDERWPKLAWRRAGLMLLALFVPEAVVSWALRQRRAAAELAEEHKGEGWTLTHGFFAIMGGFIEYEGNKPIRVLLPDELQSYSLTGNRHFPRISKAEIEDRSKGDAISKAVVILQTGWFVTQCIARRAQGLPITELELATVAFAALNFVIYVLWWDKPLNVQRGVRVYEKRMTEERIDDGHAAPTVGFWSALGDVLSDIPAAIVRGPVVVDFKNSPWLIRARERRYISTAFPVLQPPSHLRTTMIIILAILAATRAYPAGIQSSPALSLVQLQAPGSSCDDPNGCRSLGDIIRNCIRVDTFYPNKWVTASPGFSSFLVVTLTLAFGIIHCIGWSFKFPSGIEQILWRAASLSITCIPTFLLPPLVLLQGQLEGDIGPINDQFRGFCPAMTTVLLLSLYVLSRLALLVLPLLYLRSLPPAAFHVVHWTAMIPHV
ncbi:hypothetical protein BC827DRAFT_1130865 [Russula dissimulans]|nr:hypothetical protein BC827DRAFT_1130865 [Russula dissimulans]